MHWAKADNQKVAMVLLDFEKAYDRIEWPFVRGMLQAFGFPSYFCKWIDIIFKDSSTVVEINGDMSEAIPLRRSIRQGCPIAPALFVIIADALYYILRALKLGPSIKGLTLPNDDNLINAQFANDIALFLALFEDNFDNAMERLQFFCLASGAKIAPHKSTIFGWSENPPNWIIGKGWQWAGSNHIVRPKCMGGLGIKDIRAHGIALASKWIVKSLYGNEPWKVLIRNNIKRSVVKKGKTWTNIPLCDIVLGDYNMKVFGSSVFASLWKAWSQVSDVMEISKDKFMTLIHEGVLQIYKEDIQSVRYFRKHMDMLQPKEIEALTQYMRKLKLEDLDG
ncbi:uncharacterized protein LOC131037482 [Cryptomeria japonica]|uniref:uncharacterized protein LOC131037482 n=1 Tax=Cryptomeria japonica TaxID=3369 RepID=UPI0025ACFCE9|nr:uncharacterized protein LOC131037482 [Cryptomeria japonica]